MSSSTIYVRDGDRLVEFDDLPEELKDRIKEDIFERLADSLMEPAGYRRVGSTLPMMRSDAKKGGLK